MTNSILDSTKKQLGLSADYDVFDLDITMHINSVFLSLNQLGIGPVEGFMIEDATATWDAFLGTSPMMNAAKTYVYLRVKLLFDPPGVSFHIAAIEKQIEEIAWRLNAYREEWALAQPNPNVEIQEGPQVPVTPILADVDGGGADQL